MTFDFTDQTVIVTGGTRGIGRAVAEAFLQAGARVMATYSGNQEAAERLRADNRHFGERLTLHCFDIADYEQATAFYREVDSITDSLAVLVNNAGIRRDNVVGMMPSQDWQRVLDVNLTGTYNMSKLAVLKMMPARYGRIVSITSPSGEIGFEGQANYAASKAGQVAFSRSLARETAKRGITVNCVSPGFTETDLISDLPEAKREEYRKTIPLRRFAAVSEVAAAVLFLSSAQAAYITGEVLHVTGGL